MTSKLKVKPDSDDITVPALDKAINDDVERLFQKNDIEGLRELRKRFGKSAPVSIDRYVDELTAVKKLNKVFWREVFMSFVVKFYKNNRAVETASFMQVRNKIVEAYQEVLRMQV